MSALVVAGCGSVELAADAGANPDPAADAAPDTCTGDPEPCGDVCVDTRVDPNHCGGCDNACAGDEVCSMGDCTSECAGDETACDGACVDTTSSRQHCGGCNNPCGDTQACVNSLCEDLDTAAVPVITSRWPSMTGWTVPDGQSISMDFEDTGVSEASYECRTAPASMIGAQAWRPCDGNAGNAPVHRPLPVAGTEEGSYRTEMRIRVNSWTSAVVGHDFYAHHSLDEVPTCPPAHTDDAIFAAAGAAVPAADAFDATTVVDGPFITLPFTNVIKGPGVRDGWTALNTGDPWTVEIQSLRRRFVLSPDRKHLLVQRRYESRRGRKHGLTNVCRNGFRMGNAGRLNSDPPRKNFDCTNFVLNSRGQAACVTPGSTTSVVTAIGWLKLNRTQSFSPKRTNPSCSGSVCDVYLYLPE